MLLGRAVISSCCMAVGFSTVKTDILLFIYPSPGWSQLVLSNRSEVWGHAPTTEIQELGQMTD